jgi:hypothetical protein
LTVQKEENMGASEHDRNDLYGASPRKARYGSQQKFASSVPNNLK